jgi:hypothetical protein
MSNKTMTNSPRDEHHRVGDLAARWRVCRSTIYNWENAGVLPPANYPVDARGRRVGKVKWWTKEQVEALDRTFLEAAKERQRRAQEEQQVLKGTSK